MRRKIITIFRRSIFGLVRFYNRLPEEIIQMSDIAVFQSRMQDIVRKAVHENMPNWHCLFRSDINELMRARL